MQSAFDVHIWFSHVLITKVAVIGSGFGFPQKAQNSCDDDARLPSGSGKIKNWISVWQLQIAELYPLIWFSMRLNLLLMFIV